MNKFLLKMAVAAKLSTDDAQREMGKALSTRMGKAGLLLGMAAAILLPDLAFAQNFGDIGNNIKGSANGMAAGAKALFTLIGWIMAGVGIIMAFTAHKKHEPATTGILTFLAGVVVISLTAIIGTGSTTIFGSDESSGNLGSIGVGQ